MSVEVRGAKETQEAIREIIKNLDNLEIATRQLADLMRDYVHIDTGYLSGAIDYAANTAYADTPYAGAEEERGGSHAYATLAVDAFDTEAYLSAIVAPF